MGLILANHMKNLRCGLGGGGWGGGSITYGISFSEECNTSSCLLISWYGSMVSLWYKFKFTLICSMYRVHVLSTN